MIKVGSWVLKYQPGSMLTTIFSCRLVQDSWFSRTQGHSIGWQFLTKESQNCLEDRPEQQMEEYFVEATTPSHSICTSFARDSIAPLTANKPFGQNKLSIGNGSHNWVHHGVSCKLHSLHIYIAVRPQERRVNWCWPSLMYYSPKNLDSKFTWLASRWNGMYI